jgi:hypothetical protein
MEPIMYSFKDDIVVCDAEDGSMALRRAREIHEDACDAMLYSCLPHQLRNLSTDEHDPKLKAFWEQLLGGQDKHVQSESLKLRVVTSTITCRAGMVILKTILSDGASHQQSASLIIGNDGKIIGFGE